MVKIQIFEEAMCCATGVCGPSVNKILVQTTAIQRHVNANGKNLIIRRNLTQNPDAFARNHQIQALLEKYGIEILPITIVDGIITKQGGYPTFQEFSNYLHQDLSRARVH
ncbi:arsenite efflux transporter metallochaperone ArsD [Lacticaseibacillus pabuli]|uniref:Arsenite efflux transporter metallochaperone ArsD n=1 Tax=Lacticaseibacillus pabuli TaxID=3025672 RepID=A0ABY7WQY3_9LACO|nr:MULTISPECIES: arsenite efflux transporter metallochaperone ArsD [Lacticaseibacillus]PTM26461.1 arsenical resistance operon transcriptional repressor ArsD [Lacticaseibacillus rhamnosus]WDF82189.1 arsenite efflux transporter metallochaperone ArsD [Lacticaseibacillus sp. KACC 23028]